MSKNDSPVSAAFTSRNGSHIVHFIGIGGIGISALAQWFQARKWAVFGSDISPSETTDSLQKLGIKVKFGHKKGNIPRSCGLVIYTQAIRPENPELKEARCRNIPVLSYPEAVGKLTECYKTIAIAGAHGKSTTTALVSLILMKAGFDPTVIIGTKLKELSHRGLALTGRGQTETRIKNVGNFRSGKSDYLVLEADEYGKAFLNYSPAFTIATNIDREHLDVYKNLENIKKSYLKFFLQTDIGGALILNRDDKILFSLKPAIEKMADKKSIKVIWYSLYGERSRTAENPKSAKIRKIIRIAGEHNVSNALAAFHSAKILHISEKIALQAISKYRGSWRRMEYRGRCQVSRLRRGFGGQAGVKCQVYDDYAHHPTEIKATLRAFREKFPGKKIIAVFQPHQAERLKLLFKDFQSAFNDADITLILPVYRVAGRDKIHQSFTSEKLVKAIQKKYPKKLVFYLNSPDKIKKALSSLLFTKPYTLSPILVMMGAGDIAHYTDLLLKN